MFSTIVVGTDGSDTAEAAVALAVDLARLSGATLHIVNAYRATGLAAEATGAGAAAGVDDTLAKAVTKELSGRTLASAAASADGVTHRTHAVEGDPAQAVLTVAESEGADVIVVGSKGMHGARRLLGSVPSKVAHGATCHVLIAKTT